jgi:hypothetical protein
MRHCFRVAVFQGRRMHKMSFELNAQVQPGTRGASTPWRLLFLAVLALCFIWVMLP